MALYHEEETDALTSLLIAQLALDDIDDIEASRKGKTRADMPVSDEQLAFKIQAEDARLLLGDYAFASSLDSALESDQTKLEIFAKLERGEQDDRNMAFAVHRGQPLPVPTRFQRSLENLCLAPLDICDDIRANYLEAQSVVSIPTTDNKRSGNPFATRGQLRQCAICFESVYSSRSFLAPCDHTYCRDCLISLVENATRDESLYPLRCCKQPLPVDDVLRHMLPKLASLFRLKATEYDTPSLSRLYCYNAMCSAFLGSAVSASEINCPSCRCSTCTSCKSAAHAGQDCTQNAALIDLKALAREKQWQTCPGCNAIVELQQGCYHMTCRCRAQFCYVCAALWKSCSCAQWDEGRLVDAAEQQVVNQYGARAQVEQPAVHRQRVQSRAADLRNNHHCAHSRWGYRAGGGRCEECNYNLPAYLLRCKGCQMLACVRCTRNRL